MKTIACVIISLLLGYQAAYAESITVNVDADTFYAKGNTAFILGEYTDALKYLFAFRLLRQDVLEKHPEFSKMIDMAILECETSLRDLEPIIRARKEPRASEEDGIRLRGSK